MNRRDIELLSAYLDGELKHADSIKLEARLKTDPELASVLNDLRATRTLLRKLPSRKAPRNFTLTRKMAGQNPPLPRTYPIFRFATAVATLLFFFTFGINFVGVQLASQAPGFGMGGGGGAEVESYAAQAPATEEPAAPALEAASAPAEPAASAPIGGGAPTMTLAPQGTEISQTQETMRIVETPMAKNGEGGGPVTQDQAPDMNDATQLSEMQRRPRLIPSTWQTGLAIVALLGTLLMGLMRRSSARRWK